MQRNLKLVRKLVWVNGKEMFCLGNTIQLLSTLAFLVNLCDYNGNAIKQNDKPLLAGLIVTLFLLFRD